MLEYISPLQETIVKDSFPIKKILGCAGSRKTDTMIKCGIYQLEQSVDKPFHLLFLTLVGSVSDEIRTRVEKLLSIHIYKYESSNHYIGQYKHHYIEIANIDAFIHYQLQHLNHNLFSIGQEYDKKTLLLVEEIQELKLDAFYLKNGERASMILIDEFQDISYDKVQIFLEFYRKIPNTPIQLAFFGDMLQTIFPQAVQNNHHPLLLMDQLQPKMYEMNVCYRCPNSHIQVVNCIMDEYQQNYQIQPIQSPFPPNDSYKPLFFCHDAISTERGSYQTAIQIVNMIHILIQQDPSIDYSDIAIIMKKSNHQNVFKYIYQLFKKKNLESRVAYSRTRNIFNERIPIDWTSNQDKLKLLSIHGDKGKGHSVVFLLGFSGNIIPEERHLYKIDEILSHSLLNVGLTRSTRYLFVGMTKLNPSNYFIKKYDSLRSNAYFAWEPYHISNDLLYSLSMVVKEKPIFYRESPRSLPLMIPIKQMIHIPQEENLSKFFKKLYVHRSQIGISIPSPKNEDQLYILHRVSKLIFFKKTQPNAFLKMFQPYLELYRQQRIFYHDDFHISSFVRDVQLNINVIKNENLWKQSIEQFSNLSFLLQSPSVLILSPLFDTQFFQEMETSFLSNFICHSFYWNLAIFSIEYLENVFLSNLFYHYNQPCKNISHIEYNLQQYIQYLNKTYSQYNIQYQSTVSCMSKIESVEELNQLGFYQNNEMDKIYFINGYKYGFTSSMDFSDKNHQFLLNLKCSNDSILLNWIYQSLLHSFLSKFNQYGNYKSIHIYHLNRGLLYTVSTTPLYNYSKICTQLLEQYEFPPFLIEKLLN